MKANTISFRIVGILLIVGTCIWMPVLIMNIDWANPVSIPFLFATLFTALAAMLHIVNGWSRSIPLPRILEEGNEQDVAILIPTYNEESWMIRKTIESVLKQNYPHNKMKIIVGDDNHRPSIETMIISLQANNPDAVIQYHEPPKQNDPLREGEAKAGNLNSQLKNLIQVVWPEIRYIETRDCDDLVEDENFLRHCIGQLEADSTISFVQTLKSGDHSKGDPFSNLQEAFYNYIMPAKNHTKSVFPCGSGLVWRHSDLKKIGGFPIWNLVEDLYSGYLAAQKGLYGIYLPYVTGAYGQTSPEDIPNVFKQLGTWGMDTLRIWFFQSPLFVKGLSLRQRLSFFELGMFYLLSIPLLIFVLIGIWSLIFATSPIHITIPIIIGLVFYAVIMQCFLTTLCGRYQRNAWRMREMFFGMSIVYIKALVLTICYGPNRKPTYKVTRKSTEVAFYWKEVKIHIFLMGLLTGALVYRLSLHSGMNWGTACWNMFSLFFLGMFVRKSWFGINPIKLITQKAAFLVIAVKSVL